MISVRMTKEELGRRVAENLRHSPNERPSRILAAIHLREMREAAE